MRYRVLLKRCKMTSLSPIFLFFAVQIVVTEPKLPLGLNDFGDVITQNYTYVDKTELIKEIMTDDATLILITRPRLFGKSLGLSMLRYFFENRISPTLGFRDIFHGLKISQDREFCAAHRNQYPVIHLSFRNVVDKDYQKAETSVFSAIARVFQHHDYILAENFIDGSGKQKFEAIRDGKASVMDVKVAVISLCQYLNRKTDRPVILLIDEFEKPFQTAYFNKYFDQMKALISGILLPCLKDNPYLLKAVITGISVIGHDSVISELKDLKIYSVLNDRKYARYFGFTEDDVKLLLEETSLTSKQSALEDWYRGYRFSGTTIYNPWSVLEFLGHGGKAGFYWVKTAGTDFIIKLVAAMGVSVKASFESLLKNQTLDKQIHGRISYLRLVTEEECFWTLLVHTGYLNAEAQNSGLCVIRVPNKEITDELVSLNIALKEGKLQPNVRPK